MKVLKRIEQGELIPAWHGVAYFDFASLKCVVAPLPLNIVIGLARAAYTTLRFAHRAVADSQRAAYAPPTRKATKKGRG